MLKRKEAAQLSVANIVVYRSTVPLRILSLPWQTHWKHASRCIIFFLPELANFYFIFLTNTTKSKSSCFILFYLFIYLFYIFLVFGSFIVIKLLFFCRENSKIEYDSPDTRKRQIAVECNQDCAQKEKNRKRMVTIKTEN